MSDVTVKSNTPEEVAYRLMRDIAAIENKSIGGRNTNVDRKWLLDTYGECISTVRKGHYTPDED